MSDSYRGRGVSRRSVIGGAAAAVGTALTLPYLRIDEARAATPAPAASKAELAFLDRGLQHGVWVDQTSSEGFVPTPDDLARAGFTAPTFYEDAQYNPALMKQMPRSLWQVAEAPTGTHMTAGPAPGQRFLTPDQAANVDNLFSICLGDEEQYSTQVEDWTAQWAQLARSEAPNALIFTNQYSGEWSDAQLRSYFAAVQPDLLAWDNYYYSLSNVYSAGSITPLYNDTWRYRQIALGGLDGAGNSPLCFGQYTLGYRQGEYEWATGPRVVSESELFLPSYITWVLGGKWLTMFRWHYTSGDDIWLLNDASGNLTYFVDWYGNLNRAMERLSPYLTRLRARNAGIVHGQYQSSAGVQPTPACSIPDFGAATDPGAGIVDASVTKVAPSNNGLPGDVVIGTFRHLPGLKPADLAPQVRRLDTPFFMVVNAMAVPNKDVTVMGSTGGESARNAQGIRLTLDPAAARSGVRSLRMLDPTTGVVSSPTLTHQGRTRYTTDVTIGAGTGCLFWWE